MLTFNPIFEGIDPQSAGGSKYKKWLVPAAALAGLGALGYGGYQLYQHIPIVQQRSDYSDTAHAINVLSQDELQYRRSGDIDKANGIQNQINTMKSNFEKKWHIPWHRGFNSGPTI